MGRLFSLLIGISLLISCSKEEIPSMVLSITCSLLIFGPIPLNTLFSSILGRMICRYR